MPSSSPRFRKSTRFSYLFFERRLCRYRHLSAQEPQGDYRLQVRNHPEALPHLMARLTTYLNGQPVNEHYRGKLFVVDGGCLPLDLLKPLGRQTPEAVALSQNRRHDCAMAMTKEMPKNFDDYVDRFPKEVQQFLQKMRLTIKKAAPQAKETISYGIPAFTLNGMMVWFAAFTTHIGFYPRASAIAAFKKELSGYKGAKGSVQFPFDKPLPLALVTRIVKFRVKQNLSKSKKK